MINTENYEEYFQQSSHEKDYDSESWIAPDIKRTLVLLTSIERIHFGIFASFFFRNKQQDISSTPQNIHLCDIP